MLNSATDSANDLVTQILQICIICPKKTPKKTLAECDYRTWKLTFKCKTCSNAAASEHAVCLKVHTTNFTYKDHFTGYLDFYFVYLLWLWGELSKVWQNNLSIIIYLDLGYETPHFSHKAWVTNRRRGVWTTWAFTRQEGSNKETLSSFIMGSVGSSLSHRDKKSGYLLYPLLQCF